MNFISGHQLRCCGTGHEARLNFLNWYFHGVSDGGIDPMLVLFSAEAGHNHGGCVNSQHNRCWSAARIIGAIF